MVYTIDEIRKRIVPIVIKYGIASIALFGSYARGEATDESDLDFVMDKGDLKGLRYVSLIHELEREFECHVDVVSKDSSNKEFLLSIEKEEVLLYERKEIYLSDKLYQDACALVIIQIGEFVGRLSDEFRDNHQEINWQEIIGMRNIFAHNYEDVIDDIVWDVIQEDIPNLKNYLENLVND